jgi:hypothetical protein
MYWAITPMQKMIKPVENKILTIKEVYPLISILSIKYLRRKKIPIRKLTAASVKPVKVTAFKGIAVEYIKTFAVVLIKPFVL